MAPLDQLNHLLNFLAPALAVGFLLAIVGPLLGAKRTSVGGIFLQVALNFIAGALALAAGLWFFGHDGKMATYAALLVCCVLSQAVMSRR